MRVEAATAARSFFEYLESQDLGPDQYKATLRSWGPTDVADFLYECRNVIPYFSRSDSTGTHRFVASRSLGGGPEPCVGADCRIPHVRRLASFASLYADEVHVDCPLERYDPEALRRDDLFFLQEDLSVLHEIRPLLEAGLVGFTKSDYHFCEYHYRQALSEWEDILSVSESAINATLDRVGNQVSISIEPWPNRSAVTVQGPEELVPHGKLSSPVDNWPSAVRQLADDKTSVNVPKGSEAWDIVVQNHVARLFEELLWLNWYAQHHDLSYLSDRRIHFEVFNEVSTSADQAVTDALVRAFSHELPTMLSRDLNDVLRVREEETEAFHVYRDALSESMDKLRSESPTKAEEIFADLVRPRLNEIEKAVHDVRNRLKKSLTRDIVYGAGFVSIGLFSGVLPANIGEIMALVGGLPHASNVLRKASQLLDEPPAARESRYYFLWKVRNRSN